MTCWRGWEEGFRSRWKWGYHLCYGSPASAPLEMPEDMGKMVEISNGVCERLDRRMDFLHIPVPRNRAADVVFSAVARTECTGGH